MRHFIVWELTIQLITGLYGHQKKVAKRWLPVVQPIINLVYALFPLLSMPVLLADCVFVVTTNQRYQKIAKNDILYVQAEGSWADIVTVSKTYRLSTNLGQLEAQLDAGFFSRISRKHIVNIHHITALEGSQLFVQDVVMLIGPQYREALLNRLPILRTRVERPVPLPSDIN